MWIIYQSTFSQDWTIGNALRMIEYNKLKICWIETYNCLDNNPEPKREILRYFTLCCC